MHVRWMTAFIDLPATTFDAGARFWLAATGTTLSAPRGERGQFATLDPADGDAYLRVQRLDDGAAARIHLDLHVDDVPAAAHELTALGATVLHERGHVVLASPSGYVFCVVPQRDHATRPEPVTVPGSDTRSRVYQLCLDIAPDRLDAEGAFWSAATGWERRALEYAEFSYLDGPPAQPLRLLLQRLDDGSDRPTVAHLDVACGDDVDTVAAWHEQLGARIVHRYDFWTTLVDPGGLPYCLTGRTP